MVILYHVIAPAANALREARKFNLKTNFFTTLTATNLDTLQMACKTAKGLVGPISYSPESRRGSKYGMLYRADLDKGLMVAFGDWKTPSHR